MGDRRNESRAHTPAAWRLRWAQRENQRRLSEHAVAHGRWQADLDDLDQRLGAARGFEGIPVNLDSPLALKRGERVFLALPNATLIEGSASAEPHLSMNARFSWRGTRSPVGPMTAPAGMRWADAGPVTLTDRRLVFHGSKHAREWAFTRLIGLENSSDGPYTVLQVSNRQKPSGVLYPPSVVPSLRFHLALALAVFADQRQAFVASLERERHDLISLRPPVPDAALPEQAPPHLALTYAVRALYLDRPEQGTGRRIVQGTVAGVVTLLALSIVAGLSSPTVKTTSAGVAVPASVVGAAGAGAERHDRAGPRRRDPGEFEPCPAALTGQGSDAAAASHRHAPVDTPVDTPVDAPVDAPADAETDAETDACRPESLRGPEQPLGLHLLRRGLHHFASVELLFVLRLHPELPQREGLCGAVRRRDVQ